MDAKTELKPCSCGCKEVQVQQDVSCGIHVCSIGCLDDVCTNIVTRIGFSKANTYEKAAKAWNENN